MERGPSVTSLATHHSTIMEEESPAGNTVCPFFRCKYPTEKLNSSWQRETLFLGAVCLGLAAAVPGCGVHSLKPMEKPPPSSKL